MTVRWGVIGTGPISHTFVPDLSAASSGGVTGVWGRRAGVVEEFAAAHALSFGTTDLAALLERSDIDAVYIATPIATHRDIALQALDAGKHVLIEKPMTSSADDSAAIFARSREVGRLAMEAMWMKYSPVYREVMARVDDGLLGEVRSARAAFGMPFRASEGKPTPAHAGSAWLDRGIYAATLAYDALGSPSHVHARGDVMSGVDVSGYATLEYADGRFAQLGASGTEFMDGSAAIAGTRGWIELDSMFWAPRTARVHAGSYEAIFEAPSIIRIQSEGNGYRPMIVAAEQTILRGEIEENSHGAEPTLAVARILDTIRSSLL